MICKMFEICDTTDVKIENFPQICDPECRFFKQGKCTAVLNFEERLSKFKFGWMIEKRMSLHDLVPSKNGKTLYHSGIVLIHPSESTITIFRCLTSDYNQLFIVCSDRSKMNVDSLDAVNEQLKKFNYTGRLIAESDFHDDEFFKLNKLSKS